MQHNMYSLGEVAQKLGVAPFRITYAISTGHVPDASARFAGRRAFSEGDLDRLRSHFEVESSDDESPAGREAK